jgi:hypothetical protein
MIQISKSPALPLSIAAAILHPDRAVVVTTVYMPGTGRMVLGIDNISLDGALELTQVGTLVSLKESNEALAAVGGRK